MSRVLTTLQFLIDNKQISIFDYRTCTSVINTANWYDNMCKQHEQQALKEVGENGK